jgi:hypothetical protein
MAKIWTQIAVALSLASALRRCKIANLDRVGLDSRTAGGRYKSSMRWIRSNIRGLARFALAVQLTVTFAHVHLDRLSQASAHATQTATADQAVTPLAKAHTKGQPLRGAADFDCPICALIQLASASAPSAAPPLLIPAVLGGRILYAYAAPDSAASPTLSFQPRGPPAA